LFFDLPDFWVGFVDGEKNRREGGRELGGWVGGLGQSGESRRDVRGWEVMEKKKTVEN
jgi:hypothetical protein